MTDIKDSNPKTAFGVAKPCMEFVSPVSLLHLAEVMRGGAKKYGPFNWREKGVSETTYYSAIHRHLGMWFDGQDMDDESGCNHLAHVMACCAILLDGYAQGNVNHDRPVKGSYARVCAEMGEARKVDMMDALQARYLKQQADEDCRNAVDPLPRNTGRTVPRGYKEDKL